MRAKSWSRAFIWWATVAGLGVHNPSLAQSSSSSGCKQTFEERGFNKSGGLFDVYHKSGEEIFLEINKNDLEREYIFANYVERGVRPFLGEYANPKLIKFQQNGKNIDVVQTDSIVFFDDAEPLRRTRRLTMSDTVLATLKIHACSTSDSFIAQINQAALSGLSKDFLASIGRQFGPAAVKFGKASMKDWRVFSDNVSFMSEHNITSKLQLPGVANGTDFSIRVRHILLKRSDSDFTPRLADPRIGYFSVVRRDSGRIDQSDFRTYIRRWRLEKKDIEAEYSEPVKPIVFWIENTTPGKFRPYIRQGVLAWNEAFRSAGFLNAIEVHDQPEDATWEAGDISKNVIRWQAPLHSGGLIGTSPIVYDPVTGEILGADILMTFSAIGDYVDDWERLSGGSLQGEPQTPISLVSAINEAPDEPALSKITNLIEGGNETPTSSLSKLYGLAKIIETSRNIGATEPSPKDKIRSQNSLADDQQDTILINDPQRPEAPTSGGVGFADRMVEEVVVNAIMHEVGHALGLTHNFRGSHWRSIDEIFDRKKTKGIISASVMDYTPINFAPFETEQGDFASTRVGPYDSWAIEFGYRPILDDPTDGESARKAIVQRAIEPGHQFGGRDVLNDDPHALMNDLTKNPIEYAAMRLGLVTMATNRAAKGNNFNSGLEYANLYNELSGQVYTATNIIASQITPYTIDFSQSGGEFSEDFPIYKINSKAKQKEAIEALKQLVFAPGSLQYSQDFLFRVGANSLVLDIVSKRRMRVKSAVLQRLINRRLLLRMHHSSAYGGEFSPTEMLFQLKGAVFGSDLNPLARPEKDRRDQQILFAHKLVDVVNSDAKNGEADKIIPGALLLHSEQSIVSAAARPVLNELRRALFLRYPWLPMEIRAHRQELRAILNSTS